MPMKLPTSLVKPISKRSSPKNLNEKKFNGISEKVDEESSDQDTDGH
jgi:hypothetical protein